MATFREPLELQYWLTNVFSGSLELFFFLFIILISGMAATFKMSNFTFMLFIGLFAVLMSQFIGGIYVLAVLIAGLITFVGIARVVKN